ncbi:conserved hypothetical protein [Coccidioides posadasii str. Silveira]|uniref:Uncharacterized protein n=1 Tax=Coccidioides posadasii (strain RMSCC 757 / Silveira) TaxID=443226 RepID=E9CTM0_COCPS|nr:conserved hypothetical protein [Coccidioides posadasii str. Silveira]
MRVICFHHDLAWHRVTVILHSRAQILVRAIGILSHKTEISPKNTAALELGGLQPIAGSARLTAFVAQDRPLSQHRGDDTSLKDADEKLAMSTAGGKREMNSPWIFFWNFSREHSIPSALAFSKAHLNLTGICMRSGASFT